MPEVVKQSSFQLPEGRTVEVYLVRLADGRLVSRTREELEALPDGLGAELLASAIIARAREER